MAKGEFSCRDLQPKNGKASYLPIYGEKRPERYMALSEVDPKCPFLIQHEGQSVFDFEKAWAKACSLSRNFRNTVSRPPQDRSNEHDRSRTIRKGAMEISSHKTRAVFHRYHNRQGKRIKRNAEKFAANLNRRRRAASGLSRRCFRLKKTTK